MLKVNHPNIIRLYEVHESKNSIYLVLEYLKGGELFQRITESEELLSRKEIALIMR
jgi:serine/threonine protein kinase